MGEKIPNSTSWIYYLYHKNSLDNLFSFHSIRTILPFHIVSLFSLESTVSQLLKTVWISDYLAYHLGERRVKQDHSSEWGAFIYILSLVSVKPQKPKCLFNLIRNNFKILRIAPKQYPPMMNVVVTCNSAAIPLYKLPCWEFYILTSGGLESLAIVFCLLILARITLT